METSSFKTNPHELEQLLKDCDKGVLQLPDFQRSWVWEEDRIKSLIASVSRAFPIGALMTLETGGDTSFKPRPVEGAPSSISTESPRYLLLDGQQRMTSLYQVALRGEVVWTLKTNRHRVPRWFYIDMVAALDASIDREEAIVSVPEDKIVRESFGRKITLDLSSPEKEYQAMMFPVNLVFDREDWADGFKEYWNDPQKKQLFKDFREQVIANFEKYQVPVITLDRETKKEAVCVVFEKVNTGGKPLDAFELVTAMYAAEGHELRKDWYGSNGQGGRHGRFKDAMRSAEQKEGIIAGVSNTDFLQVISLFHTREKRRAAEAQRKDGKDLPGVTSNRQALLSLPLAAYKTYEAQAEQGFLDAARFLYTLNVFRMADLPYQSQLVPLAAILADHPGLLEHSTKRGMLERWYWNGVFGELYGSAVESRSAKDFMEVAAWLAGGIEPTTVSETIFRADRLKTMRMRLSAAYKGVNALLMKKRARDFRSGQDFTLTVFFDENVDIHHIFPQAWCKSHGLKPPLYDSIINKTPLSARTNRIIGGSAPSEYLVRLERGDAQAPPISNDKLNEYLASHFINPDLLRSDNFERFMSDRQKQLLVLIEEAMGKPAHVGEAFEVGIDQDVDDDATESELVLPSSTPAMPFV